jgi:orotidine-5'-phosphate decarboxylase
MFLAAIIRSLVNNKLEGMWKKAVIVHPYATYRKSAPYMERGRKMTTLSERLVLLRDLNPKPPN